MVVLKRTILVGSRGCPTVLAVGRDKSSAEVLFVSADGLVAVSQRCLYNIRLNANLFARRGRSSGVGGYDVA